MNKIKIYLRLHLGKKFRSIRNILLRKKLKNLKLETDFTIISQNCIGTLIYYDLGLKYLSPTINLYMESQDYIKFLENLDYYLAIDAKNIKFIDHAEYPIGMLEDIKIYFVHYLNELEAINCWNRRRKRVNKEKIIIIMTDRDGFNEDIMQRFYQLPFDNKILFTAKEKKSDLCNIIYMPYFKKNGQVGSLTEFCSIFGKRFYEKNFNFIKWLKRKGGF